MPRPVSSIAPGREHALLVRVIRTGRGDRQKDKSIIGSADEAQYANLSLGEGCGQLRSGERPIPLSLSSGSPEDADHAGSRAAHPEETCCGTGVGDSGDPGHAARPAGGGAGELAFVDE